MPILNTQQLSIRFEELLATATSVDIAVAWVTSCDELDSLCAYARSATARVVVGLAGNATHPVALRSIRESAAVRVGIGYPRLFHPKFYLFRGRDRTIAWIGSANLTLGGFALNRELVHEFEDDGSAQIWFDHLWRECQRNNDSLLDEYIENWSPPETAADQGPQTYPAAPTTVDDPVALLKANPSSWPAYVAALQACDAIWQGRGEHAVLRERRSYVETISTGRDLVRRPSWSALNKEECQILLGNSDRTGVWGLLGSMRRATTAVSRFQNEEDIRERIRAALVPSMGATDEAEFVRQAERFIREISTLTGFGPGVATRLLTLARPDRAISVNNGSIVGLHRVTQLGEDPQQVGSARHYGDLLRWLYGRPWYRTPEPIDETRILWGMRAALVDAFVYKRA